ncbi:MAG: IS200/IS605 family transposase [Thermodesulfobacteriota bacterium]
MVLRRSSHALYDTKYHLVWTPKYRRWVGREDIRGRIEDIFREIAIEHKMEIDRMEVSEDHVHVFLSFPPRFSIAGVVGMFKSISASLIFNEYPEVKKELKLWRSNFWERGYFVRTVGDEVTAEVIRKYIEYHKHEEVNARQLKLF